MKNLWAVALPVLCSFIITGIARKYAVSTDLMDTPNDRSSHKIPTPRGGGIGIVISFLSIVIGLYLSGEISFPLFLGSVFGGGMVAGIGLIDDHRHVPAALRLLVHFLSAGTAFYLVGTEPTSFFVSMAYPIRMACYFICIFLLVWLLNLFNFMDGIDGIAGIEAVSVLCGAAVILLIGKGPGSDAMLLIALASGCCGFLFWNWPPAKIFMGDVGSGFLGFIIGLFVLQTVSSGSLSLWVWLILLAVFLVDSAMTLLIRLLRFEKIYQAHCSHAYQKAARKYGSHKIVTTTVLFINLFWLFPLALWVAYRPEKGLVLAIIAFCPLIVLASRFGAGKEEVV